MRKNIIITIILLLFITLTGCKMDNDVKVYEDTEEVEVTHTEGNMTAVITTVDTENATMILRDCRTGEDHELQYHGGVRITNAYDREISLEELGLGNVVDVVWYTDTGRLVSLAENTSTTRINDAKKFIANKEEGKATYKGTSVNLSEYVTTINYNGQNMDVSEISTEDLLALYIYGNKLVSVVVTTGHGYVKLTNHETYIDGMVEIGYDVIVPVTDDMLITVREGTYTLRINKNGYTASKTVSVLRDSQTLVDLSDIAVPEGTAIFELTPTDAQVYIDGERIYSPTYTDTYGDYSIRVEAEGYKTYRGSFKIKDTTKTFKINLREIDTEDNTEDNTEDTSETETTEKSETETSSSEDGSSQENSSDESGSSSEDTEEGETTSTTEGKPTGNTITVKEPLAVSVYLDGDYVGMSPVTFDKVTGTHTITLYRSGYLIKTYTIQAIDNGKDDEYSFAELTSLLDLIE